MSPSHLDLSAGPLPDDPAAVDVAAAGRRPRGVQALSGAALTAVGLVTALLAALVLPATGASAAPPAPPAGPEIEAFAPFQGQTACEAIARPGVTAFRDLVLATYPETRNSGIVRTCSVRGASEHKEGRAWDWKVDAANPSDAAAVQDLLDWLLATDEHGNSAAVARRLGVMYVIWNSQIWKSYQADRGWQPYRGASPHTDHVHISFSWAGALQLTSYWTGQVAGTVQSPIVVVTPSPTASPTTALPPDAALGDAPLTVPGQAGASASPSPTPSASPSPTARRTTKPAVKRSTATPSPTRSATPRPSATRSPSPAASTVRAATPRPSATRSPTSTATRARSATPRPSATRSPTPKASVTRATDRRGLTGPWRRH